MADGAKLGRTIPALPCRDVAASVGFYNERYGFETLYHDTGFAVLVRDDAIVHLWESSDETWQTRADTLERPICTGAESFLAGTASCRIEVEGVDELFAELRGAGVLHPVQGDSVSDTDYGTREFATVDRDGNLVTFYLWVS